MTLAEIRTAVRERLDDPTFETAKIDRWANWVIADICTRANFPFLEGSTTTSTVASTQDYTITTIDSTIDKIRSVIDITNETNLQFMDPHEMDATYLDMSDDTTSKPLYWTIYGDTLRLYPIPDDAYTLQIRFKKTPTTLTNTTDVAEIPDRYVEAVVLGTYQKALEWNDDFDYAAAIQNQYEQKVSKIIADYTEKTSGQSKTIPWERPELS